MLFGSRQEAVETVIKTALWWSLFRLLKATT